MLLSFSSIDQTHMRPQSTYLLQGDRLKFPIHLIGTSLAACGGVFGPLSTSSRFTHLISPYAHVWIIDGNYLCHSYSGLQRNYYYTTKSICRAYHMKDYDLKKTHTHYEELLRGLWWRRRFLWMVEGSKFVRCTQKKEHFQSAICWIIIPRHSVTRASFWQQ